MAKVFVDRFMIVSDRSWKEGLGMNAKHASKCQFVNLGLAAEVAREGFMLVSSDIDETSERSSDVVKTPL